jgi:hypothetical protein
VVFYYEKDGKYGYVDKDSWKPEYSSLAEIVKRLDYTYYFGAELGDPERWRDYPDDMRKLGVFESNGIGSPDNLLDAYSKDAP